MRKSYARKTATKILERRGSAARARLAKKPKPPNTVGVRLPEGQRQFLEDVCEAYGLVLSDWLRHAVDAELKRWVKP
jgi:hypothetical protein